MAGADFEAQAACAKPGVDPAWWDANRKDTASAQRAIAVCRQCPVQGACLEDALRQLRDPDLPNPVGIRGGLTATERAGYHLRRPRRTQPTRTPDHTDHPKEPTTVDTTPTAEPVHVPVLAAAPRLETRQETVSVAEMLVAWGTQHPSSRIQRLAGQARSALAELQQAKRKEAAVADAEQRVAKLRQQLAAAEKALKTAKSIGAPPTPTVKAPTGNELSVEERSAIRAWAQQNGHDIAGNGRIPARVIDAYRAAHPAPLATAS